MSRQKTDYYLISENSHYTYISLIKATNYVYDSPQLRYNQAWIFTIQVLVPYTGINLGMRPANERRRYNVKTSLIGWAHT